MAFKDTLTVVQYYTGTDPYYYITDNRPLGQLQQRSDAACDRIDSISLGRVDITGAATPTINSIPTGWTVVRNALGDYTITHNLGTAAYSVLCSCSSPTPAFINQYAENINSFSVRTYTLAGAGVDIQFVAFLTRL